MIIGINPYLITDGNGQEAVKFYEEALDAKLVGDVQIMDDRVIHAHLKIGDTDLMISDTFPGPHQEAFQIGNQVQVAISISEEEKTKTVFAKLLKGGEETMPLQETFFSPKYGKVLDKFGVIWHVSTVSDR